MTLRMIGKNILLIPYKQKQTQSGILLSSYYQDHEVYTINMVAGVGDEVDDENIKEGAVVVIPRKTGHWITLENEKYIQVTQDEVLAVIDPDDKEDK
jgi:co-chaperonin GroES (HSP10)